MGPFDAYRVFDSACLWSLPSDTAAQALSHSLQEDFTRANTALRSKHRAPMVNEPSRSSSLEMRFEKSNPEVDLQLTFILSLQPSHGPRKPTNIA